jgi:hypothetical protein
MVMLHGHHTAVRLLFNSGCLGQFWKAEVGNFSRAPKAVGDKTGVELCIGVQNTREISIQVPERSRWRILCVGD